MNGFINVLKPSGITSSDVVVKIRKFLRFKFGQNIKVGHLGTLDPLGAGVLPIAIGNATKLFDYLINKTKIYRAKFVFGIATDTLDSAGQIIDTCDNNISYDMVSNVIPRFIGKIDQMPPNYSSKNVNGIRAYQLARKGIEFELKPKAVEIFDIKLLEAKDNEYVFDIACGGGTYIRSLCRDIASSLNTCGYMASIIRLSSGDFDINNAYTISEIEEDFNEAFCCLSEYGKKLPCYNADISYKKQISNGVRLKLNHAPKGIFSLSISNTPYGIAKYSEKGLKIITCYD